MQECNIQRAIRSVEKANAKQIENRSDKSKEEIAGAVSYASTRSVYDLRNTAVARFALLYFGAAALPSV